MYRLLALAKYEERYVIPTSYTGQVPADPGATGCGLDGEGGPGMYATPEEAFHAPPTGPEEPEPAPVGSLLHGRVNLLNWDGKGRPSGLFPRREGEGA
jgi:nitrate reductase beta subunit